MKTSTRRRLCALLLATGAAAPSCGTQERQLPDASAGASAAPAPTFARSDERATCAAVQALRERLLQRMPDEPCSQSSCERIEYTPEPSAPVPASLGQRILLIDDGVVVPAATRYASRTLQYLQRDQSGVYREHAPTFPIARAALEVLTTLDRDAPDVPSEQLSLANQFFTLFDADALPVEGLGHGTDMLPFLAEMVPHAQFVVSDDQLDPPLDCDHLGNAAARAQALGRLQTYVAAMQASLSRIIEAYDVHTIHLAWGLSYSSLDRAFETTCGARPKRVVSRQIMSIYAQLFRAFTQLETLGAAGRRQPVALFQAGAHAEQSLDPDDSLDCAAIARRVRVFDVAYDGVEVPPEGSHDYELLPDGKSDSLSCNDLFVVMGYRSIFSQPRAAGYFGARSFGLGLGPPAWPASPSFATPIALAHYFEVQQTSADLSTDDWLAELTRGWSAPILDPLLYDAFPRGDVPMCDAP